MRIKNKRRYTTSRKTHSASSIRGASRKKSTHKARTIVKAIGAVSVAKYKKSIFRKGLLYRLHAGTTVVLFVISVVAGIASPYMTTKPHVFSSQSEALLPRQNQNFAQYLVQNTEEQVFEYNKNFVVSGGDLESDGQGTPRVRAAISYQQSAKLSLTDPYSEVTVSLAPKFKTLLGRKDVNRVAFRIDNQPGYLVYTAQATGVKEDIIVQEYIADELRYEYELAVPDGVEPRMEVDGSIGFYGSSLPINGTVATNTDEDKELLEKVRENSDKTKLLFSIPAPVVLEHNKDASTIPVEFVLEGDSLSIVARDLQSAQYPISIDPSIYVETAQKLMRGNNESNTDFDVNNELIQKSQTTGARIDEWNDTMNLNEGRWNHSTATMGGYIYVVGGERNATQVTEYTTPGTDTFVVPAGVTSITVKMWGGGGGGGGGSTNSDGGPGGGAGYTRATLSVTPGETLNIGVGGGGTAGTFSSGGAGNNSGDGGGGGGHSEVNRAGTPLLIAGGGGGGGGGDNSGNTDGGEGGAAGGTSGSTGGSSSNAPGGGGGTAGSGGSGGDSSGNGGSNGSSEQGGDGGNGSDSEGDGDGGQNNGGANGGGHGGTGDFGGNGFGAGGGGGGGYYGGGGGSSSISGNRGGGGGGGGSSYTTGTSTTNTAGSGTTPGNSGDSDRSGSGVGGAGGVGTSPGTGVNGTDGRVIVSYDVGGTSGPQPTFYWAQFSAANQSVESSNPGVGVCTDWCTSSVYDLPDERVGFSLVAYNGFLYAIGGQDSTGTRQSSVYIAKIGANGEPSLWHPTDTDPDNWDYWYADTGLNGGVARSYHSAVAYNNRMYIAGGQTNASPGGVTTMQYADINPNGLLRNWTSGTALPSVRHGHSLQVYNDTLYLIGGNSNGSLQSTAHYVNLNTDGSMNSWQSTKGFTTGRSTMGGSFSTIWGAYIYVGGGCSAVNGSGYCTAIANDMQLASINADGSLNDWSSLGSLNNELIGYSLISWQNGLYRIGGCSQQNTTTGICNILLADVDYGVINPAGEVSTVNITEPSGTSPCNGGSPRNCDLPPAGDGNGQGGQMLSASTILNGYLYIIGGCTNFACSQSSGNVSYVAVGSDGSLQAPSTCSGTSYGAWCVDSSNRVNGTSGVSAPGVATFNNRIYIVGGIDQSATGTQRIYYNSTNTDGSLSGGWSSTTFAAAGMTTGGDETGEKAYTYAFARANPSSAGSNPGNLYVLGGCSAISASAGCSGSYNTSVYKCNIATNGSINGCTTSGQLQIDTELASESNQGLGLHSGTVYAGYIYLIGGYSDNVGDRDTVFYAKIDNNNNIVDAESGTANPASDDDDWIESPNTLSVGRRRGWAFGYNGHIYAIGGYDDSGTGIIPFIEWSKLDVSDGSSDPFVTSSVTLNQRWGLTMTVSNSYAYTIGGCDVGASPSGCSSFEPSIQTFQLYNNDSGSIADFTAQSDQTFATGPNRIGASAAISDGYLYVAGGCTSASDCTTAVNNVQYASISADNGSVSSWSSTTGTLPAVRAWGSLEVAGGSLYYMGGQSSTATDERAEVYYATPSGTGDIPSWSTASNGLPSARTRFSTAVWNNRLYVVGGLNSSAAVTNTVYVSPQLNGGGDITASWSTSTAFNVARTGAAVTAYANNLYLFGGYDGSNYLSDVQFAQINADGSVDPWSYTRSLPGPLRDSQAISANGYVYLVGGRSANTTCTPKTIVAPVSANTTIATGNNPTGLGEWYETNTRYTGDRYGAAVAYSEGKIYTMGGGCASSFPINRHYQSTVNSQPQVAIYSRMMDTDTDVFPTHWLMNGLDNSIGARWNLRYRSMNDTDGVATDCGTADMATWGQDTDFGEVTLGQPEQYIPKDGSGNNTQCARYFYFYISIDASKTFGYPEDVNRGPTIHDLSLFFRSDPSKRLRHGKTFTGGEQQPLDTPFLLSNETALLSGATFANDSSVGNVSWTSPGNAAASDNSRATAIVTSHTDVTNYLKATNFGFDIPSSATITGIEITTETSETGGTYVHSGNARLVKNGTISGGTKFLGSFTGSDTVSTAGSSSDLWGQTWLPSDINSSNFGLVYSVSDSGGVPGGVSTINLDHVQIRVYYDN